MIEMIIGLSVLSGVAVVVVLHQWFMRVEIQEGYVAVLYRKGKLVRTLEAGRYRFPRSGTSIRQFDVRQQTMMVSGQEVLTQDQVTVRVSPAVRFRVADPIKAATVTMYADMELRVAAQMALREAVSVMKFDELMESRASIGQRMLTEIKSRASEFGYEILAVDVRDVMLSGDLKRSYAEVIKARQEGLAALERARGESAAIRNLANAARVLEDHPGLVHLRMLQTVSREGGNTLVVGMPDGVIPMNASKRAKPKREDESEE